MITADSTPIFVVSDDNLFFSYLVPLFNQKKIRIIKDRLIALPEIKITKNKNQISLIYNNASLTKIDLPCSFENIFKQIKNILNEIFFINEEFKFFPYAKKFEYEGSHLIINEIHNIILSNLLIYKKEGLKKNDLYFSIWPNDKNLHLNKLDTHLTNLKNLLKEKANYTLGFNSSKGVIKLLN